MLQGHHRASSGDGETDGFSGVTRSRRGVFRVFQLSKRGGGKKLEVDAAKQLAKVMTETASASGVPKAAGSASAEQEE